MASLSTPNLPPRLVDERKTNRKRTLLGGKVVYNEGNFARDCTIRDLSETGAKIVLEQGECIPTRVFLIDRRTGIAYESSVVWIKAPSFGLKFHQAFSITGELPDRLQYLKRIWNICGSPLGTDV